MMFKFLNVNKLKYEIRETKIDNVLIIKAVNRNKCISILKAVFEPDEIVFLADIDTKNNINRGIGSKLLVRLEDICKEEEVIEIYGNLSNVDIDHKDRLIYFYKKHGYSVLEENESNNYWGKITKSLL